VPLSPTSRGLLSGNGHGGAALMEAEPAPRPTSNGVRVLIVHSDASCREEVARLLRSSDIEVVDVVPDGDAAIRAAKAERPDLVLVGAGADRAEPAGEATLRLSREVPGSRVLLFGDGDAEQELDGSLLAGAAGYVRIDGRNERLGVTVRIALALIAFREVAQYERGAP
jgi:DNA-binding NarL/FixJ family response regulator